MDIEVLSEVIELGVSNTEEQQDSVNNDNDNNGSVVVDNDLYRSKIETMPTLVLIVNTQTLFAWIMFADEINYHGKSTLHLTQIHPRFIYSFLMSVCFDLNVEY